MDSLRKFLGLDNKDTERHKGLFGNEFRKPTWFDDGESDDELYDNNKVFGFQIFTNPLEMQKHFEQQMQAMLESLEEFEEKVVVDENVREKYMKPGFEEQLKKQLGEMTKKSDTDLDDEIYADQLHSLLQRITPPELESKPLSKRQLTVPETIKRTDEEQIWDRIHGSDINTIIQKQMQQQPQMKRPNSITKIPHPRGGVFEGAFQGPKIFRQSIITQTIRKPDGTYETKKTVCDADGNTNTTITRTREGKTETFTYDRDNNLLGQPAVNNDERFIIPCNRNITISTAGYALPKNLW